MKYKKSDETEWNDEVKQIWKGESNRAVMFARKLKEGWLTSIYI